MPTIKELLVSAGDARNGKSLFENHCISCRRINMEGKKFGPELSQIGENHSMEGLYREILHPNEGVSFGYESTRIMETMELSLWASLLTKHKLKLY